MRSGLRVVLSSLKMTRRVFVSISILGAEYKLKVK